MFIFPSGIPSGAGGYQPAGALYLDGSADYLSWTPSGNGSLTTHTFSCWVKRPRHSGSVNEQLIAAGDDANNYHQYGFNDDIFFTSIYTASSVNFYDNYAEKYRDPTAWMNVVVVWDTTNGTAADRNRVYINGTRIGVTVAPSSTGNPTSSASSNHMLKGGETHYIGKRAGVSTFGQFYLADVIMLDGVASTDASQFGETDSDTGIWVPKSPSGLTFGTNGFWLDFSDGSDIGNDVSGNNNDFTPTSMGANNIVVDGPANSTDKEISIYPTIDPVGPWGVAENTLSNNNMTWVSGGSSNKWNYSTMPISNTDKVYFEVHQSGNCGGSHTPGFSITKRGHPGGDTYPGAQTDNSDWGFYLGNGSSTTAAAIIVHDASFTLNNQAGGADGDVYQVARDGASLWFGRNNTWYNSGDPTDATTGIYKSGSNPLPTDEPLWVAFHSYGTQATLTWKPYSGDWTYSPPSGFGEMKSTITGIGNFCTWNILDPFPSAKAQLSEGNTVAVMDADSAIRGTMFFDVTDSTGFYWETTFIENIGNASHVGIATAAAPLNNTSYIASDPLLATYLADGAADHKSADRDSSGTHPTYTNGDTISVAVKGGAIWFAKNGSWVDGANGGASSATVLSELNAGTTTNAVFTSMTGYYAPHIREHNGTNVKSKTNWGQQPFKYTPPTNMKRLMTADFSEPTVTDPSAYFGTILYSGNSTSDTNRTGLTNASGTAWTPDFAWLKGRSGGTATHKLYDSVRGAGNEINPDSTNAQSTYTAGMSAFISGGITVGNGTTGYNESGRTFVVWCLKANGAGSSDDTGGITVTRSTADHQGFSICKGTSTSGTQNFAHGLGAKPEFVIVRDLEDSSQNWQVQHKDVNANMKDITTLGLNRTNDAGSSSDWWGAEPTSTLQYFTTNQVTGTNDFVAYLFRRIPGMIGIGSYVGNGNADGTAVIIDDGASGFKPAFLLIKEYDGSNNGNWFIRDNARDTYNPSKNDLYANRTDEEYTDSNSDIDFTANGFKIKCNAGGYNENNAKNLYLAFAESPFGLNNRVR